jgi:CheY-like chemotaxis protein
LVADDNTNIQKMVTLAFQERGVEVIAVGNGEAAVRRIPDANPDLVLADVFMPVRNGYEVCEFVKKDSRFAHTPVILLVGAFDPLDEKEARRVGADGVLKKPFVPPDPLIAMVMSALEKNPRVMAEMAKAKEAAAAPPPPVALENPATAEPKPLPHFPEPTPEEAAIIYGFGKGVRGMDSDEEPEDEKTKSAPAPKADTEKSGPKVASGPKTSVSVVGADDDDEEFDDMATATDRRRATTDFEVPDNVSADPIYSYGRDFEPITFPSEKDVPPKHVKEPSSEAQPVASESSTSEPPALKAAPEASVDKAPESTEWDIRPESELGSPVSAARSTPAPSGIEEHAPVARVSGEIREEAALVRTSSRSASTSPKEQDTELAIKGLPQRVFEAARDTSLAAHAEASSAAHTETDEAPPARERGWMDMMESPSASGENHWTTNLGSEKTSASSSTIDPSQAQVEPTSHSTEHVTEHVAKAFSESASVTSSDFIAPKPSLAETDRGSAPESVIETAAIETPAPESWTDELAALPSVNLGAQFDPEPRSFGESTPQFGGSSYHFAAPSDSDEHDHLAAIDEAENSPAIENSTPELLAAPADLSHDGADEAHAPSEPLFVTEEARDSAGYASQSGESHSTEHPAQVHAESSFSDPIDPREHLIEPAPSTLFADDENSPASDDFSERIPTLPPANREALSDIAFLMPPPGATEILPTSMEGSGKSTDVDDVVRKVLEKLQPQLQQMLSQGMKPLLESLIQNELQNKEK